jgi:hypothetical protein
VPDVDPPHVEGDERATLTASLDYLRSRVVEKLVGVDEVNLRVSTVPSGTTMYWLGTHMSAVEINQFQRIIAGRPDSQLLPPAPPPPDEDDLTQVLARYTTACEESRRILDACADLDQLAAGVSRRTGNRPTVRWVLVHMIEETARHAGHLDILREQADGSIGR